MSRRPDPLRVTPAQLSRAQRWPIGTLVTATDDDGVTFQAVTGGVPWRVRGRGWVILLGENGTRGAYALARVVERQEGTV